jgi:hypothetical protein
VNVLETPVLVDAAWSLEAANRQSSAIPRKWIGCPLVVTGAYRGAVSATSPVIRGMMPLNIATVKDLFNYLTLTLAIVAEGKAEVQAGCCWVMQ